MQSAITLQTRNWTDVLRKPMWCFIAAEAYIFLRLYFISKMSVLMSTWNYFLWVFVCVEVLNYVRGTYVKLSLAEVVNISCLVSYMLRVWTNILYRYCVPTNIRFRPVSVPYSFPRISDSVFVSEISDFVFDSGKAKGNENDNACFLPFPFRFQPYSCMYIVVYTNFL